MGPWSVRCPADQVVVGFDGRAGFDLDQVSFECAPLVLAGSASGYQLSTGPTTSLPVDGGPTGPTFQDGCSPNQVVVGTTTYAGQIIYQIGLTCSTPEPSP